MRRWEDTLFAINVTIVVVFCAEAALKIVAYGLKPYFFDDWNKFDFAVSLQRLFGEAGRLFQSVHLTLTSATALPHSPVCYSPTLLKQCTGRPVCPHDTLPLLCLCWSPQVAVASAFGIGFTTGNFGTIARVVRIVRLFRLVNKIKALRVLFNCLVLSLPSLWNVGTLIFLLFYIFAVLGEPRCPPCCVQCLASVTTTCNIVGCHGNFDKTAQYPQCFLL